MKTLKTLALGMLTLFAINVYAQGKMDPQEMAQKRTADIKAKVTGITSDEENQILTIEQNFAKSAQDARTANAGDRDAMRNQMKQLKQDRDSKIKGVLSADQYTQYIQMEQDEKAEHGGKRGGK
jgi:protein CpxP